MVDRHGSDDGRTSAYRYRMQNLFVGVVVVTGWLVVAGTSVVFGQGVGVAPPTPVLATPTASLGDTQHAPSPSPGKGIDVPTSELSPLDQCMLDAGWFVVRVHAPSWPGGHQWYEMESDLPEDVAFAAGLACRERYPSRRLTDEEIRVVYARWVGERECLIRLGYQPQEPPSEEAFLEQWKTGPWMPIYGTDYTGWSDEEYQEAKRECWLEMYDR